MFIIFRPTHNYLTQYKCAVSFNEYAGKEGMKSELIAEAPDKKIKLMKQLSRHVSNILTLVMAPESVGIILGGSEIPVCLSLNRSMAVLWPSTTGMMSPIPVPESEAISLLWTCITRDYRSGLHNTANRKLLKTKTNTALWPLTLTSWPLLQSDMSSCPHESCPVDSQGLI